MTGAPPTSRRERAKGAAVVMVCWVALLWVLEVIDVASRHALDTFGVSPREIGELRDVVPAAFLHFGFDHLAANSVPLLVLGFLVALSGLRRLLAVVTVIILASGLGVWLTAPEHSTTAGASGVVFGRYPFGKRNLDPSVGARCGVFLIHGGKTLGGKAIRRTHQCRP